MDISVVIPVYNVEKYLRKCVDSVLNQTISNYEIILVDDGSPDGCPAVCDAYAAKYSNVIAFHKANGGLSDARNYGVQHASADYVVFVDSDDYVDPEYLESLWKLHVKYGADITVQGVRRETESGKLLNAIESSREHVSAPEDALALMLIGKEIGIFAVGKLYPRTFLLNTPFPVGKLHEDIFTTYLLLDQGTKAAIGKGSYYHYVIRDGSILTANFSIHHMDSFTGANEIIQFVKAKYPGIINAAYIRLALESNALLHRAMQSEQYAMVRKNVMTAMDGKWQMLLHSKELPTVVKLQLLFCKLSPNGYKKVYALAKQQKYGH
ncbi:MAG: glycosyltransferase [Clostridia bacterium]|nr:glycosyltransferase [Clostridia bacterium]